MAHPLVVEPRKQQMSRRVVGYPGRSVQGPGGRAKDPMLGAGRGRLSHQTAAISEKEVSGRIEGSPRRVRGHLSAVVVVVVRVSQGRRRCRRRVSSGLRGERRRLAGGDVGADFERRRVGV